MYTDPDDHGRHRKDASMLHRVDRVRDGGACLVAAPPSLEERSLVQARQRLPRTAHGLTDRAKSPNMSEPHRDQAGTTCRQGRVERRRAIAMSRLGPCEIGPRRRRHGALPTIIGHSSWLECEIGLRRRRRHGAVSLRSAASVAVAGRILRPAVRNCHRWRSAPSCKGPAALVASSTRHACCVAPTMSPHIRFQHCHGRRQEHKKFTDDKVYLNEGEPK